MGLLIVQMFIFYQNLVICGRLLCSDTFVLECSYQERELRNCIDKYIKYTA